MGGRKQIDPEQLTLDFTSPLNERLAAIRSLDRVECGLGPDRLNGVIELLQRVAILSTSNESCNARVIIIATQLADRRKVTEKTVRNWRADAVALGWLKVDHRSHRLGGHRANEWTPDYPAILAALRAGRAVMRGPETGRKRGGNGAVTVTAPGAEMITAPGAETVSALTELAALGSCLRQKDLSGPGRNRAGNHFRPEERTNHDEANPGGSRTADPAMGASGPGVSAVSGAGNGQADPPDRDELREELVSDHPLLRDSLQRPVARLPPGRLAGNVFAPIVDTDLGKTDRMTLWFRQQLGVRRPLTRETEADLLLVLAAAIHADGIPRGDVRRTRAAIFAAIVSRRLWRKAVGRVTAAHDALERLLSFFPDALTHPEGLGPRVTNHEGVPHGDNRQTETTERTDPQTQAAGAEAD